jgi:peroxiredoxin
MRPKRNRFTRLALSLTLVSASFSLSCKKNPGPQVGDFTPAITLPDLGGDILALGDLRGQVVVLNFWATWCPPCVNEMPSLQKLHDALADKGLSVVAVSVDERFSDIEKFVGSFELTFTILHDEGMKVSRSYQTFKFPETYIIGRDGRLRSKVVGERDWVEPSVIRDMVALLNERSGES